MKFFVTTPIYYINDKPHIGHAYSTIVADTLARFYRLKGREVFFSVGVDENAQKTVDAARTLGKEVTDYTREMSLLWESTWRDLGITHDTFIRTTSSEHQHAVHTLIARVKEKGDIYAGTYEGYYCIGCESFKKEDDLIEGQCPDHKKKPEWVREENYFFALSKYQDALLRHINEHPDFVQPASRRNEVIAFIERGLQDFSVSRSTQKWGIPWPGDDTQVVYVWFDALVNYLTVTGFPQEGFEARWPADLHIVGKDIIKFHCIYWPAMLLSADLPLPKTVFAHGFFTINGEKISKSLGNAIDPKTLVEQYGIDALRYFLLREIPFGGDGDFSFERIRQRYESDLQKGIGNFVSRVVTLAQKESELPPAARTCEARGEVERARAVWEEGFTTYRLDQSLDAIWGLLRWGDGYIERTKPWELAKRDEVAYRELLAELVELTRIAGRLIQPFLPDTSAKICEQLFISDGAGIIDDIEWGSKKIDRVEKKGVLFPALS